jgi:glycosyltransferase involved in cell wall biosynthesis
MDAPTDISRLRVALVHDWLTGMRGGEKVLEVLCEIFPKAPLFTLLHIPGSVSRVIEDRPIRTSFIQRLPGAQEHYRRYLPIFPRAIESLDLSSYDLVVSTSHCVAKGAIVRPGALHICYCFTPMRYVWDQYEDYFGKDRAGLITRAAMSVIAPRLRAWDRRTAERVHCFISDCRNIQERIRRIFGRESDIVYPPVDVRRFMPGAEERTFYLVVSALVPYKRVDLAVEAFNRSGRPLTVVGKGPELERLRSIARPNIEFLGWRSDDELAVLYRRARALIFPGEEDFGIVPLEAMASGTPVVALGMGGALETVVDGETGVFFKDRTAEALEEAIVRASTITWDPVRLREQALRFSREHHRDRLESRIREEIEKFFKASSKPTRVQEQEPDRSRASRF